MDSPKHIRCKSERPFVFRLDLDCDDIQNTMSMRHFHSILECMRKLSVDDECRSIVISSLGKDFCTGVNIDNLERFNSEQARIEDIARRGRSVDERVSIIQRAFSAIENCPKPVIAAINGACAGPGMGLISACDIRYCDADSWFQVKELELGIAADSGTLQRLPKIMGNDSFTREMCYTARRVDSDEALKYGLVSRVFDTRTQTLNYAMDMAERMALVSPVGLQNCKKSIVFSQHHSTQDGLDHIREINCLARQCEDFHISMGPAITGAERPNYAKY
ncbi:delta(3,5)-Delta(2,4)-dienoyl-CoA isomerase, mitochondrial [Phlebotomus argentipes]|uniref:delta(3,5)-Delta(2,4)-dienoyl-CoA isomerase, mitochondrial n=1 Tax=Phlebotomus argentipes TaxID=94469 RepID=UPI0028931BDC|nr:delta(3,5)-Delta(2,4)-dienoyl-CoA isomerase, mitochondrial [Phlebotomus argentipes]